MSKLVKEYNGRMRRIALVLKRSNLYQLRLVLSYFGENTVYMHLVVGESTGRTIHSSF